MDRDHKSDTLKRHLGRLARLYKRAPQLGRDVILSIAFYAHELKLMLRVGACDVCGEDLAYCGRPQPCACEA